MKCDGMLDREKETMAFNKMEKKWFFFLFLIAEIKYPFVSITTRNYLAQLLDLKQRVNLEIFWA
jgi:hypothetical protein